MKRILLFWLSCSFKPVRRRQHVARVKRARRPRARARAAIDHLRRPRGECLRDLLRADVLAQVHLGGAGGEASRQR
jgi:hypothetical protein